MEEVFQFCYYSSLRPPSNRTNPQFLPSQILKIPTTSFNSPHRHRHPLHARALQLFPFCPHPSFSPFHEKLLFLDSLGIDLFAAATAHPPVSVVPLADFHATVDLLRSIGLTAGELRCVCGMCPEVLAAGPQALTPVLTFLLREAGIQGRDLRRVIHRRPRLLVSDVAGRLRPTLFHESPHLRFPYLPAFSLGPAALLLDRLERSALAASLPNASDHLAVPSSSSPSATPVGSAPSSWTASTAHPALSFSPPRPTPSTSSMPPTNARSSPTRST